MHRCRDIYCTDNYFTVSCRHAQWLSEALTGELCTLNISVDSATKYFRHRFENLSHDPCLEELNKLKITDIFTKPHF